MSDDSKQSRRNVLKAAGGLAGMTGIAGIGVAQNDTGGQQTPTPGGQAAGEQVGMVTTEGNAQVFTAPLLWVEQGTTVTWVNESGSHSSTAYAEANDGPQRIPQDAEAWDSGVLSEQGAEFQYTFEVSGVYDYYCTPHESQGMVARVVVGGDPNLQDAPAMAEPQGDLPSPVPDILTGLNQVTQAMFGGGGGGGGGDGTATPTPQ